MTRSSEIVVTVGEPNWAPLESILPPEECQDYMYMGSAGKIELYKHRWTRRYLNIGMDCRSFYLYSDGEYVEISQATALANVRS